MILSCCCVWGRQVRWRSGTFTWKGARGTLQRNKHLNDAAVVEISHCLQDFGDSACAGSKLAVSNEAETALFSRAEFADDARKVQCEIPTHI